MLKGVLALMKSKKHGSIIVTYICFAYVLFMVYILFLKNLGKTYDMSYTEYLRNFINLIPGWVFYDFLCRPVKPMRFVLRFVANLLGNIVLFVPFGFFTSFYIPRVRRTKNILLLAFGTSFLVETIQLFGMLGAFDIDDIFLNGLGAYIGYILYILFSKGKKDIRTNLCE